MSGSTNDPLLAQPAVVAALVTASVAFTVATIAHLVNARSSRITRRRDAYAKAFEAYVGYREHPYQVRRRQTDDPETERRRLTEAMTATQRDLAYHRAWLRTESRRVADRFDELVAAVRRSDGRLIHDAWLQDPVTEDEHMNIAFDDARADLTQLETKYLLAAAQHLSLLPWWLSACARKLLGINKREHARLAKLRQPPRHGSPESLEQVVPADA